jgi:hypothetical protein
LSSFAFHGALAFAIERGRFIPLAGDACSRLLIIFKSHDLHASDIRRNVREIDSFVLA